MFEVEFGDQLSKFIFIPLIYQFNPWRNIIAFINFPYDTLSCIFSLFLKLPMQLPFLGYHITLNPFLVFLKTNWIVKEFLTYLGGISMDLIGCSYAPLVLCSLSFSCLWIGIENYEFLYPFIIGVSRIYFYLYQGIIIGC